VNHTFAARLGVATVPMRPVPVKMANGQLVTCDSMVPQLHWVSHGQHFHTDLRVLELGAYDGVLGMDWLDSFSPMTCHWKEKRISFDYNGK
jgi:hypothetical protein